MSISDIEEIYNKSMIKKFLILIISIFCLFTSAYAFEYGYAPNGYKYVIHTAQMPPSVFEGVITILYDSTTDFIVICSSLPASIFAINIS